MNPIFLPIAFIEGLGGPEMMLIFFIVLLLFGGQKMPELAKGLAKSIKEFKKATSGVEEEFKRAMEDATSEAPKVQPTIAPPVATVQHQLESPSHAVAQIESPVAVDSSAAPSSAHETVVPANDSATSPDLSNSPVPAESKPKTPSAPGASAHAEWL